MIKKEGNDKKGAIAIDTSCNKERGSTAKAITIAIEKREQQRKGSERKKGRNREKLAIEKRERENSNREKKTEKETAQQE